MLAFDIPASSTEIARSIDMRSVMELSAGGCRFIPFRSVQHYPHLQAPRKTNGPGISAGAIVLATEMP
jgi:hypothetical protein